MSFNWYEVDEIVVAILFRVIAVAREYDIKTFLLEFLSKALHWVIAGLGIVCLNIPTKMVFIADGPSSIFHERLILIRLHLATIGAIGLIIIRLLETGNIAEQPIASLHVLLFPIGEFKVADALCSWMTEIDARVCSRSGIHGYINDFHRYFSLTIINFYQLCHIRIVRTIKPSVVAKWLIIVKVVGIEEIIWTTKVEFQLGTVSLVWLDVFNVFVEELSILNNRKAFFMKNL